MMYNKPDTPFFERTLKHYSKQFPKVDHTFHTKALLRITIT